jgi:ferredoxin
MEDLALTNSEKDYLQREASLPGLYCQGCGQCVKQCLARLPIPDLMRAYMYTYGYRKPAMAKELIVSLGLPSHVCDNCGECIHNGSTDHSPGDVLNNIDLRVARSSRFFSFLE